LRIIFPIYYSERGKQENKLRPSKATGVISYGDQILKWNDVGKMIYNGEAVKGSHITDLIKDVVSPMCNYQNWRVLIFSTPTLLTIYI